MTTRTRGRKVPPKRELLSVPAHDLTLPDGRVLVYRAADIPGWLRDQMAAVSPETLQAMSSWHIWVSDGLRIFATHDTTPRWGPLIHVSVSTPLDQEYPTWDDLLVIRDAIFGDTCDAMMIAPRKGDYVNLHKNTFHWWETPEDWGIQ